MKYLDWPRLAYYVDEAVSLLVYAEMLLLRNYIATYLSKKLGTEIEEDPFLPHY